MDEKNSRVDLTIQDCASGDYDGKCIDVTIEGRETNQTRTDVEGNEVKVESIFPGKMRLRLKLGNL